MRPRILGEPAAPATASQMSSLEHLGRETTLLPPRLTPVVGQAVGQVTLPLRASASCKWAQNGIQPPGSAASQITQMQ